jgi:hypothetical protein
MKLLKVFAVTLLIILFPMTPITNAFTINLGKTHVEEIKTAFSNNNVWELREVGIVPITPNTVVYGLYRSGELQYHMVFQNGLYVMSQSAVRSKEHYAAVISYINDHNGRQMNYLGLHVKLCYDSLSGVKRIVYLFCKKGNENNLNARWAQITVTEDFLMDFLKRQPNPEAQSVWAPPLFIYNYWKN